MAHQMALVNATVTTNGVNTRMVDLSGVQSIKAYNNASGTTSNFNCSCIIPLQTVTSNTDFTTITTNSDARKYKLESNTTFAAGNAYLFPFIVKADGSISFATASTTRRIGKGVYTHSFNITGDGSVTFSSSNTSVATVNSQTGQITPLAAGTTTITATASDGTNYRYLTNSVTYSLTIYNNDVKQVPLWYIAEYSINNVTGTSMATTENAGYCFSWNDAMTTFTGSTTSYNIYKKGNKTITNGGSYKYHIPCYSELRSIVPSPITESNIFDLWSQYSGVISCPSVIFGYNSTSKGGITETSWWKSISSTEVHAIRFLGTEFCSAWKYKYANNSLTIYATLIDVVAPNASSASSWYNSNWSGVTFANNDSKYAVQRTFYSSGYRTLSGPSPVNEIGKRVLFWSTTESSDKTNAWMASWGGNGQFLQNYNPGSKKEVGAFIRLFKDN